MPFFFYRSAKRPKIWIDTMNLWRASNELICLKRVLCHNDIDESDSFLPNSPTDVIFL